MKYTIAPTVGAFVEQTATIAEAKGLDQGMATRCPLDRIDGKLSVLLSTESSLTEAVRL